MFALIIYFNVIVEMSIKNKVKNVYMPFVTVMVYPEIYTYYIRIELNGPICAVM